MHPQDSRSPYERDQDRVIFSHAFQRLAGVTQVARGGEDSVFHTRQQHSIKVAQIGRRLAERQCQRHPELRDTYIDPNVVETACLIHDIGHPPFGHVGEEALNDRLEAESINEGFDANAQSFRIITKLSIRQPNHPGMNLTRATMAASVKYPWLRRPGDPYYAKKWSIYCSERADFEFAFDPDWAALREISELKPPAEGPLLFKRNVEAQLMDWADDIAYSLHDLEEFHRCSVIPWAEIFSDDGTTRVIDSAYRKQLDVEERRRQSPGPEGDDEPLLSRDELAQSFGDLRKTLFDWEEVLIRKYEGDHPQRLALRAIMTDLSDNFMNHIRVEESASSPELQISQELRGQVAILKEIIKLHVIRTPAVEAQRLGYRNVVERLYDWFREATYRDDPDNVSRKILDLGADIHPPRFTPGRLRPLWDLREQSKARFAADCVASLTDHEALSLFSRLYGIDAGSILNRIVH